MLMMNDQEGKICTGYNSRIDEPSTLLTKYCVWYALKHTSHLGLLFAFVTMEGGRAPGVPIDQNSYFCKPEITVNLIVVGTYNNLF